MHTDECAEKNKGEFSTGEVCWRYYRSYLVYYYGKRQEIRVRADQLYILYLPSGEA